MPVVPHRDRHARRRSRRARERGSGRRGSVYLAALLSRLAEHLRQARRVGVEQQRLGGQRRPSSSCRPASISGRLGLDARCAPRGAARPRSLRSSILPRVMRETSSRSSTRRTMCADLPLHHARAARSTRSSPAPAHAQHVQRVADRRQRIAQLVRQHRQELVLAAVGLAQRLLGALALGDVDHRADEAEEAAVGARSAAPRRRAPSGPARRDAAGGILTERPALLVGVEVAARASPDDASGVDAASQPEPRPLSLSCPVNDRTRTG